MLVHAPGLALGRACITVLVNAAGKGHGLVQGSGLLAGSVATFQGLD